ncbi:ribosomal protein S18-alanine N-acetyltransferase [Paenibacillus beijingensis]|uniref:Alanine acetyltransferase n=1 Tax=Paenibacillus beijingensis TaxID=1126833 RepID=A0A0D5NG31_9BACL|nr:ribosomal protein S18-alanine N-acetyltransferase [Paenibacillus beijingensis]AJY73932.1 alanine acetyltransferase [Paenibacillus beijingensis]
MSEYEQARPLPESGDTLEFRGMKLEDVAAIAAIEQEAFESPWTKEAFVNELTNNHFARYLVMVKDGEIIGYSGMWVIIDEAHVTNIAVRSDYQGQKLGQRLMSELQKVAVFCGARKMTLEVRVSNERAQRLYRKFGFEPSGIRPGYYTDNGEDALIMWAELQQAKTGDWAQ